MLLAKEVLIADIRKGLAILQSYVRPGGRINLTDGHVQSESVVEVLLNQVYGWNVTSTNKDKANYPCIDLIDAGRKLGIQVTAERDSDKVNDTLACLEKHKMAHRVAQLKVLLLVPKQKKYTVNATCHGISFDWTTDVFDFDDVIAAAQAITDLQHLERVQQCVVNAMPSIFPQYSVPRIPAVAKEPPLTELAIRILVAAVAGMQQKVYVNDSMHGQNVSAGSTTFLENSNDGRRNAAHLTAVEELVQRGLIEDKWGAGQVFAVANAGYTAADEAKEHLPPDANLTPAEKLVKSGQVPILLAQGQGLTSFDSPPPGGNGPVGKYWRFSVTSQ